jgi:uncharacterized membrane protein YeaQ/YmgE (transglycosylase-associated protein family)
MLITFDQIIVWGIVGLLGGSLAGLLAKGEKRGFGIWKNLGLGLAGALVGGLLFRLLGLLPSLEGITISLRDVVSAFVGSILVLVGLWVKGRAASANEP